jgi:hypothetical protein
VGLNPKNVSGINSHSHQVIFGNSILSRTLKKINVGFSVKSGIGAASRTLPDKP